jgi:putative transposase
MHCSGVNFTPAKDIQQIVSKTYKVTTDSLSKSRRGIQNEPRNVAIYLARSYTGKKLEEVAAEFHIDNYSTVSSIIVKIRDQKKDDKSLAKQIAPIEQIIKNQRET